MEKDWDIMKKKYEYLAEVGLTKRELNVLKNNRWVLILCIVVEIGVEGYFFKREIKSQEKREEKILNAQEIRERESKFLAVSNADIINQGKRDQNYREENF